MRHAAGSLQSVSIAIGENASARSGLSSMTQKQLYIDSLSRQYANAGFNSWRDKDSSYITLATRDGYLDITSFSNAYYKKIAH